MFEPSLVWTGEALLNERKITEVLKTVEREATSKNLKAAAQAVQFARSISTPIGGQGVANGNGANGGGSPSGGGGLFAKKGAPSLSTSQPSL